jgi:L-amino acid N-acyltransferase YncA
MTPQVAVITSPGADASIALHSKLGFELTGKHPGVGFKFGSWFDTVHMQRPLGGGASDLPSELKM